MTSLHLEIAYQKAFSPRDSTGGDAAFGARERSALDLESESTLGACRLTRLTHDFAMHPIETLRQNDLETGSERVDLDAREGADFYPQRRNA
jgi:hypothetical protein